MTTAPTTHTIELPLPPKECSPNYRGHWTNKANPIWKYRYDCRWAFYKAYTDLASQMLGRKAEPLRTPITIHLEYYCGGRWDTTLYRPKDTDNAIGAFKSGQDSLIDAGLIPDDSARYVKVGRCKIYRTVKEHKGRCCLVVTIEEATE